MHLGSRILFTLGVLASTAGTVQAAPGLVLPAPIHESPRGKHPFAARHARSVAGFDARGVDFALDQGDGRVVGVRWSLVGAAARAPRAESALPVTLQRLAGPEGQPVRLQGYEALRWDEPLPGVDLVWRSQPGSFEWRLEARAGPAWRSFEVEIAGAEGIERLAEGSLGIAVGTGVLVESGLTCFQPEPGSAGSPVPCTYADLRRVSPGVWRYTVEAGPLDPGLALVVDPTVFWSAPFGGSGDDYAAGGCAVPDRDVFVVAGPTLSEDFPGAGAAAPSGLDGFIAAVKSDLSGVETLYLEGAQEDFVAGVACAKTVAYLVGSTSSKTGLRTTGKAEPEGQDAFVARYSFAPFKKDVLVLLGSTGTETGQGIAVNESLGQVAVVANSGTGCPGDCRQAVAWLLSADLATTKWTQALGGAGEDIARSVALTNDAVIHLVGWSTSTTLTTGTTPGLFANGWRPPAAQNGFLAGLSSAGLVHLSWIGGDKATAVHAIAVGPGNALFLAGSTESVTSSFGLDTRTATNVHGVTANAPDPTLDVGDSSHAETEAFVMKVTGYNSGLWDTWRREWCTAVGSHMHEAVFALSWTGTELLVAGNLDADSGYGSLPGLAPPETGMVPGKDFFAMRLSGDGTGAASRILGGSASDFSMSIFSNPFSTPRRIVVVGSTTSTDFPASGTSVPAVPRGLNDAFILSTDVTAPQAVEVKDNDTTTFGGDVSTASVLRASWSFVDPEETLLSYQLGYSEHEGDCPTKAANLVLPFQSTGNFAWGTRTGGTVGTRYFAVVKATNSTRLSTLACSDGVTLTAPPDAGSPGPDASTSADAASPGPDAAVPGADAELPGADAGSAGEDAASPGADAAAAVEDAGAFPSDAAAPVPPDAAAAAPDAGQARPQGTLGWSCGCSSTPASASGLVWLLPLLGTLVRRRA